MGCLIGADGLPNSQDGFLACRFDHQAADFLNELFAIRVHSMRGPPLTLFDVSSLNSNDGTVSSIGKNDAR